MESGIVEKLKNDYYPLKAQMGDESGQATVATEQQAFTFDHTLAAFLMLVGGLVLSLAVFAAGERLKIGKTSKRKKDMGGSEVRTLELI